MSCNMVLLSICGNKVKAFFLFFEIFWPLLRRTFLPIKKKKSLFSFYDNALKYTIEEIIKMTNLILTIFAADGESEMKKDTQK